MTVRETEAAVALGMLPGLTIIGACPKLTF